MNIIACMNAEGINFGKVKAAIIAASEASKTEGWSTSKQLEKVPTQTTLYLTLQ